MRLTSFLLIHPQNTLEEMIATTAYLELFLRKISHPSLLYVFLKLLCVETFDDQQILLNLISRMSGSSKVLYKRIFSIDTEHNFSPAVISGDARPVRNND
jgi:hypothetical protein